MRGVNGFVAVGLVCFVAAVCWVPHLFDSFRLDETLTAWVIRGSPGDSIDRAVHFQPQPGYYAVLWPWARIAGLGEVALRIPSLLAMLAACFVLARVGERLTGDRETGVLAAVVLASSPIVYRDFLDARSYAVGLLLLVCLAATLHAWLTRGRWRDAWLSGALLALLPQLHLFLVLAYPAFALYAALKWQRAPATAKQAWAVALLLAVGALLYVPVAVALAEHGGSYSFAPRPQTRLLFMVVVWVPAVAGLLAGLCAAGFPTAKRSGTAERPDASSRASARAPREVAHLLAAWLLVPLLLVFGVSVATGHSVFLPRYLIAAAPALALLYAGALAALPSGSARVVAAVVVAVAAFATNERPPEDFRAAARAVREFTAGDPATPVLFASGMIESQDEAWLNNPALADYMTAAATYYPLGGRLVMLPRRLSGPTEARAALDAILGETERFAVIEWSANGADVLARITPFARNAGYRLTGSSFGGVRVAFFSLRRPSASPRANGASGR